MFSELGLGPPETKLAKAERLHFTWKAGFQLHRGCPERATPGTLRRSFYERTNARLNARSLPEAPSHPTHLSWRKPRRHGTKSKAPISTNFHAHTDIPRGYRHFLRNRSESSLNPRAYVARGDGALPRVVGVCRAVFPAPRAPLSVLYGAGGLQIGNRCDKT